MRGPLRPGLDLLRRHLRAYLALNAAYFGLVALGAAYAFAYPEVQRQLIGNIVRGFEAPPLSLARDAYLSGNVGAAALVTFLVNFFLGSLASLTLPSLVIPFAGAALGFLRALLWSVALAPSTPELARAMIPHSGTLLLEGEGYVLAMLGVHLLWAQALPGLQEGLAGFARGYVAGLRANLAIYALVALVLAVAAVYEAFEIIYLVGTR